MADLEIGTEYKVNGRVMVLSHIRYVHDFRGLQYSFSDGFFVSNLRETELAKFVK